MILFIMCWRWIGFVFLYRYCQGGELFHFILERKHLNEREAAMIMYQLLSALVYLHSQNISHRDIKPENFMLANKNDPTCVKMIDFGLSKDFSGQETMKTMSGSVSRHIFCEGLYLINCFFIALLHRARSFPTELQLENWCMVSWSRTLHHALRKSSLPGKFRAWNHRKCYQRWFPLQSRAFLTTFTVG